MDDEMAIVVTVYEGSYHGSFFAVLWFRGRVSFLFKGEVSKLWRMRLIFWGSVSPLDFGATV